MLEILGSLDMETWIIDLPRYVVGVFRNFLAVFAWRDLINKKAADYIDSCQRTNLSSQLELFTLFQSLFWILV